MLKEGHSLFHRLQDPYFRVTSIHPFIGTSVLVWGLHFQLEHDSDAICKDVYLDYIDIVCFETHISHGFVFLLKDIVMGEKASTY